MSNRLLCLFVVMVLSGCQSSQNTAVVPTSEKHSVVQQVDTLDYSQHVGKRIEVVGVVTNAKCPQVCGIDVWDLDAYRGLRLKLSGVLRETIVTQESINQMCRTGNVVANRGAGRFYALDDMKFEILP